MNYVGSVSHSNKISQPLVSPVGRSRIIAYIQTRSPSFGCLKMIPPATPASFSNHDPFAFLTGNGEMGQLIRAFDWSRTSLGPVQYWPQSLRMTLSIMLAAKLPMGLWWGADLVQFYNDAYRPCLGQEGKHPRALGQRGPDCWPEEWPLLAPLIGQVLAGGEATWQENVPIPIYRDGRTEHAYWTFSYSPVRDETGRVAGVLVLCQETTRQVENLRLAGQRFQNFVRQATVGMIVLSGEEMVVEVVNNAYSQLVDRSPSELLNKPLFSVIPEAKPHFYPILEKVLVTGERFTCMNIHTLCWWMGCGRKAFWTWCISLIKRQPVA
jgi:PAS domain-containing protein